MIIFKIETLVLIAIKIHIKHFKTHIVILFKSYAEALNNTVPAREDHPIAF